MKHMDFKNIVIDYIFNDKTKEKVIAKWNKDINIPFLNEKTERKIFESIWESVESVIKAIL